jgi:hypothetical protein
MLLLYKLVTTFKSKVLKLDSQEIENHEIIGINKFGKDYTKK